MLESQWQPIFDFLLVNGFKQVNHRVVENDKCSVIIHNEDYPFKPLYIEIEQQIWLDTPYHQNTKASVFNYDFSIYWVIGYLTYNDLMDKNYINPLK